MFKKKLLVQQKFWKFSKHDYFAVIFKVFDSKIVNTDLKPDNFDTLTSDIDFNLENEDFALNTGFIA